MDLGLEFSGSLNSSFTLSSSSSSSSSSSVPQSQRLRELLATSWRLGYRAVAVNVVTSSPLRAKDINKVTHVPLHTQIQPPSIDLIATAAAGGGMTRGSKKRRRDDKSDGGGGGVSSSISASVMLKMSTIDSEIVASSSSSSSSFSSKTLQKRPRGEEKRDGRNEDAEMGVKDDDENNEDEEEDKGKRMTNEGTHSQSSSSIRDKPSPPPFVQLSRLTVTVTGGSRDAYDAFNVKDPAVKSVLMSYDIIACQPSTPEAMIEAAKSGNVDIIDLDMAGGKAPFLLTQADVESVLSRGVVFEIPYAPCIRDASCRRSVASNASALLRLCRGKGVIITSSARTTLEVRAPRDVTAIAELWGMKKRRAQVAQGLIMPTGMSETGIGEGAISVLKHAEERLSRLRSGGGVFVHVLPTGLLTSSISGTATSSVRRSAVESQHGKGNDDVTVISTSQADAMSLQKQHYSGGGGGGGGGSEGVTFLSSLAARGISATNRGWAISVPPVCRVSKIG